MSNTDNYTAPQQGTAGATDVVTQLQGIVRQLSAWVTAFQGRPTFGSLALAAAASTVVMQPAVQSNSFVQLTPTNAAAATLMGSSKALYISTIVAGSSFTVATADGTSAAGTEKFSYSLTTPV